MKDGLLNSEARLEVWQRELREIRCNQLGVPKLEDKNGRPAPSSRGCAASVADSWPPKKPFPAPADLGGGAPATAGSSCVGSNITDTCGAKRIGRLSGSGRTLL